MVISALEPDSRGSGGVRVLMDGGPFATVAARDVAALGLRVGGALDERQAAEVEARAEAFAARTVALRILGYRALPGREIVRRLVRKGHDKAVAEGVVAALGAEGLVDDAEFARHYTRTRAARRRLGPARLEADLRRLGVDERTAAAAVGETLARERIDPARLLREAATRKLREMAGLDRAAQRRRLKAFLLRRGFGSGEIVALLRELIG
jgi:regulatory protein